MVPETERIIDGHMNTHDFAGSSEPAHENGLRPQSFEDFPGQDVVKAKLRVFVEAAKARQEPLDHVLLHGPPGLGKTTLAHILANTMGSEIRITSGPALDRKGDLAAILTSLRPNSFLFIDEIHRLNRQIEEYLYSAMEDFAIDLVTGEGLGARTMRFQIAPFTLVGATTRVGLLNAPFRDRFGIVERLAFYTPADLVTILRRSAKLLGIEMDAEAALEIARRCRGTPRVANRLLKRVRDFAQIENDKFVNLAIAKTALDRLEVDQSGLEPMDRRILELLIDQFSGGPAGIETLAASLSEETETLEEVHEPYLLQEGFLQKTARGRIAARRAYEHLGRPLPKTNPVS